MTPRFEGKKVAVIGDLVADQYLNGSIARVSREAPVFILRHDDTVTFPGAAANAAANIASLGGVPMTVGIVGDDQNGHLLLSAMSTASTNTDLVVSSPETVTTTKVRVLAGHQHAIRQQVIRIDYERNMPETASAVNELAANAMSACEIADAIVISDYNYGVASKELFNLVSDVAKKRKIPLIVDSRFRLADFTLATSATPNQDEVEQILGVGFTDEDCTKLCSDLGLRSLVVTNGSKGLTVFEPGRSAIEIAAVGSSQPVDVTGAGDTVIAAYALGLAAGLSFVDAARLANHAGGIVVMKKGTAVATASELAESLATQDRKLTSTAQ